MVRLNSYFCVAAEEEFDELCFEFGVELDEVVSCISIFLSTYSTDFNF